MDDLNFASASSLAHAIRARQVSASEVVYACLNRIEAVNPRLKAVVQTAGDRARVEAREADARLSRGEEVGPLHGVPFTLKDCFDTEDLPSTSGTKGRASYLPQEDATILKRFRAAGAILLGKTNVPELALTFESDNLIYGRTNNPYDTTRTPGGSSGGEAAIIAAGGSPLGIGSEAGGSIRVPAHFCGIAGIKPTTGRTPRTGHFPPPGGWLDPFWQIGPIARNIEDLALALPLFVEPDHRDTSVAPVPLGDLRAVDVDRLRIAFHADNGIFPPEPPIAGAVRAAAASLGPRVEERRPPMIDQSFDLAMALFVADRDGIRALLALMGTLEVHPLLEGFLQAFPPPLSMMQFSVLLMRIAAFRAAMRTFFTQYDVLICPACGVTALPHGQTQQNMAAFSYTLAHNLSGLPAAVVRCGSSPEGLPIGVQVVAQAWREDIALAGAQRLEAALGGYQRPPERARGSVGA